MYYSSCSMNTMNTMNTMSTFEKIKQLLQEKIQFFTDEKARCRELKIRYDPANYSSEIKDLTDLVNVRNKLVTQRLEAKLNKRAKWKKFGRASLPDFDINKVRHWEDTAFVPVTAQSILEDERYAKNQRLINSTKATNAANALLGGDQVKKYVPPSLSGASEPEKAIEPQTSRYVLPHLRGKSASMASAASSEGVIKKGSGYGGCAQQRRITYGCKIDNLPEDANEDMIKHVFSKYGNLRVKLIERYNHRTKDTYRFAFVNYFSEEEAWAAVEGMHERKWDYMILNVLYIGAKK